MSIIKAVKALVAENEALKAEVKALRQKSNLYVVEEKLKTLLAECNQFAQMTTGLFNQGRKPLPTALEMAVETLNTTWTEANKKYDAYDEKIEALEANTKEGE